MCVDNNSPCVCVYMDVCFSYVPELAEQSVGNNRDEANNKLTGMEKVFCVLRGVKERRLTSLLSVDCENRFILRCHVHGYQSCHCLYECPKCACS